MDNLVILHHSVVTSGTYGWSKVDRQQKVGPQIIQLQGWILITTGMRLEINSSAVKLPNENTAVHTFIIAMQNPTLSQI